MNLFKPKNIAYAHCDLPCGVYDPAQARINAESVVNASKKYQESDDASFKQRCITIKEDKKRASGILHCAITSIDACATMFTPFMPTTSKIVSDAIQKEDLNTWGINEIKKGAPLENIGHLFKKFD